MRKAPREVTPVVHEGVRYEAPHWGHELEPPRELPQIDEALMGRINDVIMRNRATLARRRGPIIEPDILAEVLRADGSFTDDELAAAIRMWSALFSPPAGPREQNGGHLLAYDAASGDKLWRLQVYQTAYDKHLEGDVQDVFVTSLAIDGASVIVRDEKRRVHRVDVTARAVVESYTDTTPTPIDVARAALRALPRERRKELRAHIMTLKKSMDRHNIASFAKHARMKIDEHALAQKLRLGADDGDVLRANLQRLLDELGALAHVDPLVETARQAGLRCQAAVAGGADPHVLFTWYQTELSWIFTEVFVPS